MPQIVQSETVDKNISAVEQGASFGTVDLVTKLDVKKKKSGQETHVSIRSV